MVNDAEPRVPALPENEKAEEKTVKNKKKAAGSSRNKKRNSTLAAAIVFGALLVVLMITLAFFTSFDEVTNVFAGGKLDIVLTEPHWSPSKAQNIVPDTVLDKDPYVTNNENTAAYVFLEVTVPYGTLEVEENSGADKGSALNTAPFGKPVPLYKFGVLDEHGTPYDTSDDTIEYNTDYDSPDQIVNPGWVLLTGNPQIDTENHVIRYIYAHVQVDNSGNNINALSPLGTGVTTGKPLFNTIKLVNFDETYHPASDYNVLIKAYGIQANFLSDNNTTTNDPEEVWNILQNN